MEFIDFFAGVGGFRSGLERAGMKCVGYCEFDKHARASYQAMYDTEGEWTEKDIRDVKGVDLPNADVWTLGFPCQDISIAGSQKGIHEGTRSGLFYEIIRLLEERETNAKAKPKYLIIENVRNLLSIDKGWGFYNMLTTLGDTGYDVEWQLYNSKDYGVPQNRERVYLIGHLREECGREVQHRSREGGFPCLPQPKLSNNKIEHVGAMTHWKYEAANKVISDKGVSPTLLTRGDESRGVKVMVKVLPKPQKSEDGASIDVVAKIPEWRQRGNIYASSGLMGALCSTDYKTPKLVKIKNASTKGYLEAEVGDGIDLNYPNSKTRRGRVQKGMSQTVTTASNLGVLQETEPVIIRRLTPLECWRLQGFTDEQYQKASEVVSKTQLYKQAGNAVTVNVVEAIGKSIMKHREGGSSTC